MSWMSGLKMVTVFMKLRKLPRLLRDGRTPDEVVEQVFGGAPKEVKEFAKEILVVAMEAREGKVSVPEAVKRIASRFGMSSAEFMDLVAEAVDMLKEYFEEGEKLSSEIDKWRGIP